MREVRAESLQRDRGRVYVPMEAIRSEDVEVKPTPENALDLFRLGFDTIDIAERLGLTSPGQSGEAYVVRLLEEARHGSDGFVAPPVVRPVPFSPMWARKRGQR
jgi:hypothetical protein